MKTTVWDVKDVNTSDGTDPKLLFLESSWMNNYSHLCLWCVRTCLSVLHLGPSRLCPANQASCSIGKFCVWVSVRLSLSSLPTVFESLPEVRYPGQWKGLLGSLIKKAKSSRKYSIQSSDWNDFWENVLHTWMFWWSSRLTGVKMLVSKKHCQLTMIWKMH